MNFEIEGEKYAQAIGDFLLVYYREELKNGSLKKTIKVYAICFAVLIGLCFITPGMKELYFLVMGFLLFMVLLVGGVVALSVLINKKKVKNSNIVKVEQIYEDKISVNAYLVNGSIEKTQYNYSDIKKVVETLGGLPSQKLHCSVLAEEGIKKAIEDYLSKQKKEA